MHRGRQVHPPSSSTFGGPAKAGSVGTWLSVGVGGSSSMPVGIHWTQCPGFGTGRSLETWPSLWPVSPSATCPRRCTSERLGWETGTETWLQPRGGGGEVAARRPHQHHRLVPSILPPEPKPPPAPAPQWLSHFRSANITLPGGVERGDPTAVGMVTPHHVSLFWHRLNKTPAGSRCH